MVDFPIWFNVGWYGGLVCCVLAIATNVLYSALHRHNKTRQLASAIIICIISALLLFLAIIWFNSRFSTQQAMISTYEVVGISLYIALFGWIIPLGITCFYCIFAPPLTSTAVNLASTLDPTMTYRPPRYQPGAVIPFVFSKDMPWGWLEYHSGSFHGQRLELKRAIATIGRDEQCDIWIDDDMASRHHAELAWDNGRVFLTDCESLNGVLLNKEPVHGTAPLASNDLLQIGTHSFVFVLAEQKDVSSIEDDPLNRHTWRTTQDLQTGVSQPMPFIGGTKEADTIHPPAPPALPPLPPTVGGPMRLKLPSRQKN